MTSVRAEAERSIRIVAEPTSKIGKNRPSHYFRRLDVHKYAVV